MKRFFLILTGTDPVSRKGGISFALPGYLRALDSSGISWCLIPTHHPSTPGGKWIPWLKAFPRLVREIVVARRLGKSVIVYSHPGAGVSLLRQFFIMLLARACGASTIMQLHAIKVYEYLDPIKRLLFRLAISPVQALAVLTPWWRQQLSNSGLDKPLFVIPNPLPAEWDELARNPRHPKPPNPEKIVLLSLTRLVRGKGVDTVIEAMPFLPPEFELIVAGDGPQRVALQQRVKALGLDVRVRFTGWVSGQDKQRLFDEANVFVLPTRYDSFGMGFLEAMSNGIPVVALDWGPIADVVPNGRCGLLIQNEDPQLLAQAIERMMDPELRSRMGHEARRWVVEQFGAKQVGSALCTMFEKVAG